MRTVLSSGRRETVIGPAEPFCIIGERINPTGRKIFQQQLRDGDLSRVETDVADQVAGGAMVLDVNMGAPLVDEAELMVAAVKLIQGLTDLPHQLGLVGQRRAHVHVEQHGPAGRLFLDVDLHPGQVAVAQLLLKDLAPGGVDPLSDDAERLRGADHGLPAARRQDGAHRG